MTAQAKPAQAWPLDWPKQVSRTKYTSAAKFGEHTVKACVDAIRSEVIKLGGMYLVISTNIPLRQDGDPYSNPGRLNDPGVAIYFRLKDKPYCMPCDKWVAVEHNLWAVAKNIEAMRGMQRWGVGSVEQSFAGFAQLGSGEDWRTVLGLTGRPAPDQVEAQYRRLAATAHPDKGGSLEAMQRLNAARDAARKDLA